MGHAALLVVGSRAVLLLDCAALLARSDADAGAAALSCSGGAAAALRVLTWQSFAAVPATVPAPPAARLRLWSSMRRGHPEIHVAVADCTTNDRWAPTGSSRRRFLPQGWQHTAAAAGGRVRQDAAAAAAAAAAAIGDADLAQAQRSPQHARGSGWGTGSSSSNSGSSGGSRDAFQDARSSDEFGTSNGDGFGSSSNSSSYNDAQGESDMEFSDGRGIDDNENPDNHDDAFIDAAECYPPKQVSTAYLEEDDAAAHAQLSQAAARAWAHGVRSKARDMHMT